MLTFCDELLLRAVPSWIGNSSGRRQRRWSRRWPTRRPSSGIGCSTRAAGTACTTLYPLGPSTYICAHYCLFLVLAQWIDLLVKLSNLTYRSLKKRRRVKHVNRKQQSTDLAQFYLQMKKRYIMHMSGYPLAVSACFYTNGPAICLGYLL